MTSILSLIGNTPLVALQRLTGAEDARVLVKLESRLPGGSVKDRIALAMIEAAEQSGELTPGVTIVEPTSGNTGIGLALVAAVKGYRCMLTMPASMSIERRRLLERYGAQIILTPEDEGMEGAVRAAEDYMIRNKPCFLPNQFENPANPAVHRRTTGPEIVSALGGGTVDAFVAGVGTGGTITGVGEVLRRHYPQVKIIAVEPAASPVLSGGCWGIHNIQGIGAGFVPGVLNRDLLDEIRTVRDEDALAMAKTLSSTEGISAGTSAGAALLVALQVARELGRGHTVVTVLPDGSEKYLAMG